MYNSKYLLSSDFKILYLPNSELKLSCKEFDFKSMNFKNYEGNIKFLDYYYEIDKDFLNDLMEKLLQGEIGIELDKKEMELLVKLEDMIHTKKEISNNKQIMFNYCVLKMKLAGFPEKVALAFIKNQFFNESRVNGYPNILVLIDNINSLLNKRKFWINKDSLNYVDIEKSFIKTVFDYKIKLKSNFSFSMFKSQYVDIIKDSFVPKLVNFNETKSYLVEKPTKLETQKKHLYNSFKYVITGIIDDLLKTDYTSLSSQEYFIHELIDYLSDEFNLYVEMQLQKK